MEFERNNQTALFDANNDNEIDASLKDGAARLLTSVSSWLIPTAGAEEVPLFLMEPDDFTKSGRHVLQDLSRHYLAIAIGCGILSTVLQGISLGLMLLWSYTPIIMAISLMIFGILIYWLYAWKQHQIKFKRLWATPYPYGLVTAVLGCLSQHTVFFFEHGFNMPELAVTFFLMQALYFTLVASTYQQYMQKWKKFMRHRKIYNAAVNRKYNKKKNMDDEMDEGHEIVI